MTATLNTFIKYDNGYITPIDSLDEPMQVEEAEIVEDGCKGWGKSNAVVLFDHNYYLATVSE